MNLTSLSGGLMLAALAGVWLVIFVPSWMKSSTTRERQRNEVRTVKALQKEQRARSVSVASTAAALRVRRAFLAKRITGLLSLASLGAGLWTLAVFGSIENPWIYLGGSSASFALFFSANRLAHALQMRALTAAPAARRPANFESALRRSNFASADAALAEEQLEQRDPRAWAAPGVPSQILRSPVGTLDTPEIAEVLDFAASAQRIDDEKTQLTVETASINLDEILRRRRANG